MIDSKDLMKRREANGDKKATGWQKKAVRLIDATNLQVGDVVTFPDDYHFDDEEKCIVMNSEQFGDYICLNNQKGEGRIIYPGNFMKVIEVCEKTKDGIVGTGVWKHADGTACKAFQAENSIEEGMNVLLGKTIQVKRIQTFKTRAFRDNERLIDSPLMEIDFVDVKSGK